MRLYKNKDDALIAAFLKWDNALYLKRNVFRILTNRDIVKKYSLFCQNAEDKEGNATRFVETISNLDLDVWTAMTEFDIKVKYTCLEHVNRQFIKEYTGNILTADFIKTKLKTQDEYTETDGYDEHSYKDGYWRPEDAFLNLMRHRNDRVGYHNNTCVTVPNYDKDGKNVKGHVLGNRFRDSYYQTNDTQFPKWQETARHYDYHTEGVGYDADAYNDRRTQTTRGYDMSGLSKK